jgi:hypothetical protein
MNNIKYVCDINLEYFKDIPNAVEYLKNSCEIEKVYKILNSKVWQSVFIETIFVRFRMNLIRCIRMTPK